MHSLHTHVLCDRKGRGSAAMSICSLKPDYLSSSWSTASPRFNPLTTYLYFYVFYSLHLVVFVLPNQNTCISKASSLLKAIRHNFYEHDLSHYPFLLTTSRSSPIVTTTLCCRLIGLCNALLFVSHIIYNRTLIRVFVLYFI